MIPVKCARCGFDGHVRQDFGHTCTKVISLDEYERMQRQIGSLQASIDMLMFEYCPDEMTPAQVAVWADNQRAVAASMDSERQP